MRGPALQSELGRAYLVPDRIRHLALQLPPGWDIAGDWVLVWTKFGLTRQRQYTLRRPSS